VPASITGCGRAFQRPAFFASSTNTASGCEKLVARNCGNAEHAEFQRSLRRNHCASRVAQQNSLGDLWNSACSALILACWPRITARGPCVACLRPLQVAAAHFSGQLFSQARDKHRLRLREIGCQQLRQDDFVSVVNRFAPPRQRQAAPSCDATASMSACGVAASVTAVKRPA